MRVLFVHGMGRSPASGWFLLRQLRRAGLRTSSFGYNVSGENFAQIVARLVTRVLRLLEEEEELVLVGHSLGGAILRQALGVLGESGRRVHRLFLPGSPVRVSLLAKRLGGNLLFRLATKDCGQLLASSERMSAVASPAVPTTGIAGTRGIVNAKGPFGAEANDGVVSISEVSAGWLQDQVLVPVVHTLLPSSRRVGAIILQRLRRNETWPFRRAGSAHPAARRSMSDWRRMRRV
jgi:pimeloyl-ACP methyl ester carboxylesterase